ncbi:MAG: hypothetical protein DCC74_05770 [Proteobacteria bacterium]|nr:MAG: hypothetical protein DCC74_05770 [Pseudomonadota bacterium]
MGCRENGFDWLGDGGCRIAQSTFAPSERDQNPVGLGQVIVSAVLLVRGAAATCGLSGGACAALHAALHISGRGAKDNAFLGVRRRLRHAGGIL